MTNSISLTYISVSPHRGNVVCKEDFLILYWTTYFISCAYKHPSDKINLHNPCYNHYLLINRCSTVGGGIFAPLVQ